MKIGIVADTSSNFTPSMAEELGIHIVPMHIMIDQKNYKDGFDLSLEEFYKKMATSKESPTTSQPAIGEFIQLYKRIEEDYDKILSIHPAGFLSGTVETAKMAAQQVNPEKITVFDSELVSILTGYLVHEAKRLVDSGKSFSNILERLTEMKSQTIAYVVLENFDQLVRSGRLPRLAGQFTKLTKIKPILKISSNGIELKRLVRTSKRAVRKVKKITYDCFDALDYSAKIDVAHGDIPVEAEETLSELLNRYPDQKSKIHRLASVIGVHTGAKILGYTIAPEYSD